MTLELVLLAVAAGMAAGTLIGAIGIGGVLLVPALVLLGGLGVDEATPIASMSFFFPGVAGTVAYARSGRIDWTSVRWLVAGVAPGALLGAALNVSLSPEVLTAFVAVVLGAAAVRAFAFNVVAGHADARVPPVWAVGSIGVVVGVGSALTGTGGPVLFIPIMLLVGGGVASSIAASQPIQVPIAVLATAVFLAYGAVNWELGLVLGLAQVAGVLVGARVGDLLPAEALRGLVGVALAAAALVFSIKVVTG